MGVPSLFFCFFVFWLLAWLLTVSYKDRDGMGVPSFIYLFIYLRVGGGGGEGLHGL